MKKMELTMLGTGNALVTEYYNNGAARLSGAISVG